jgi:molecular chaperone Hsp33
MKPSSTIQRFFLESLDIYGAVVKLTDVWQAMQIERGYSPLVAGLLGEMAAVCTVFVGILKQPGRLIFQVRDCGPVECLMVDCSKALNLRGFARDKDVNPREKLPSLFEDGQVELSLEIEGQETYENIIPLEGGSIAQAFMRFFGPPEQHPIGLWLASDQDASAALFMQKLPDADAKDLDGWTRVMALAETVRTEELLELDAASLLHRLFAEEDVRLYPARAVTHDWPYDPEDIIDVLLSIGEEKLRAMLAAEDGELIFRDRLSNHTYRFDAGDIDAIFRPRTLH